MRIPEWAAEIQIGVPTIYARLRAGRPLSEVLSTTLLPPGPKTRNDSHKKNSRRITIGHVTHHLAEWCRITGISKVVFAYRMRHGMTEQEALTAPLRPRTQVKIERT